MRVLCESCSKPQPPDWQAGDHCVWCGEAVRREVRCFWCVKWTPLAKYCRGCGTATVETPLYGAARMLKDGGADRFSIPRMLAEFEPDQIENFTRIYQEHAIVAAQHVAQVEFLEKYLRQKHWSAALEETLAPQLPWPQERLASYRAAARAGLAGQDGLAKVRAIGETSPFRSSKILSLVARVALDDWTSLEEVMPYLFDSDEGVRTEVVLALTHWRVLYGPGLPGNRREVIEELKRCPLEEQAASGLALLGESTQKPLPPGDFATAIAGNDVAMLATAALQDGDELRQFAAAQKLIGLGELGPVASALGTVSQAHQQYLIQMLQRRRKPVPQLREVLFEFAANSPDRDVRRSSCFLLCYGCPPQDAVRVAQVAGADQGVYQALLQKADLPPEALNHLGLFLLQSGAFRCSQYGLSDVAKEGRMPAGFVQRHWRDANATARCELLQFAEMQLKEYGDEALHLFLVDIAFTPGDVKVQSQAWTCLYRWYDSFGYPRHRPLTISPESMERFFGSARAFLARFARFLDGREILHEILQRDAIAQLMTYPDPAASADFAKSPQELLALAESLTNVMWDIKVDFILRLACTDLLGFLGWHEELRKQVVRLLKGFASTDLDLQSKRALERMAQINAPVGKDAPDYRDGGNPYR